MKIRALLIASLLILFFTGCPEGSHSVFSQDPDPIDSSAVVPAPAEDLYIVVNVAGKIAGFRSSAPEAFVILTNDVSIEPNFSEIRISADLKHLLYARETGNQRDLVLLNLESKNLTVIAENLKSNESEFIDDERIIFSHEGSIWVYQIGLAAPGNPSVLIPHQSNRCNHWMQLSPDLSKIVFKDQDAEQPSHDFAMHAWTEIDDYGTSKTDLEAITTYINGGNRPVGLYDSFYYSWRNNSTVIFKLQPGISNSLFETDLITAGAYPTIAVLKIGVVDAVFEKLLISPDGDDLLLYGDKGLYRLDLVVNTTLSGTLQVDEVYRSPLYDTKYAAFGNGSLSFVAGTSDWMGIYNTEGLERTSVSLENVIGEDGTLYALHCR